MHTYAFKSALRCPMNTFTFRTVVKIKQQNMHKVLSIWLLKIQLNSSSHYSHSSCLEHSRSILSLSSIVRYHKSTWRANNFPGASTRNYGLLFKPLAIKGRVFVSLVLQVSRKGGFKYIWEDLRKAMSCGLFFFLLALWEPFACLLMLFSLKFIFKFSYKCTVYVGQVQPIPLCPPLPFSISLLCLLELISIFMFHIYVILCINTKSGNHIWERTYSVFLSET